MIYRYCWPTPNGYKTSIFMKETELFNNPISINAGNGEQFLDAFLLIPVNHRNPVIVDPNGLNGKRYPLMWTDGIGVRPPVQEGLKVLAERRQAQPVADTQRGEMFGATRYLSQ
jgi:hypothetical protein